jgi:glycosyltransferase involved in cell wall biosynthesis
VNPPLRILHLIERLSLGGASRSLLGLVKYTTARGLSHSVLSLLPPDPAAAELARSVDLAILPPAAGPSPPQIAEADIVHIHFWNAPALYQALRQPWGPARILLWSHVSGDFPPQMLTREVAEFCDALVASCPHTASLPVFQSAAADRLSATVLDTPDFAELHPTLKQRSTALVIAYLGTLDFVKMHPDFVRLHAELPIPNLRVLVVGDGPALPTLRRQAEQSGCPERFSFLGFQTQIAPILSLADIFGYPLAPDNYATAELALQEAMFLGLPAVLLATGGPASMIEHEQTGLLAKDTRDYAVQLRRLADDPELRLRLGRQAAAHARQHWGSERIAPQMLSLYHDLLNQPKRPRPPLHESNSEPSGAACFLQSLGSAAPQFNISFAGSPTHHPATVAAADRCIAASPALLASPASGGVLHYRFSYPQDPHLRFWSGLILENQGRPALAAMEFRQAAALGFDPARLARQIPPNAAQDTAFPQLQEGPTSILYCGNSVTVQRDGFCPILHRWLQDRFGHQHTAVNLSLGGVGSFGAAFLLHRHLDLHPQPGALSFVECASGDIGTHALPAETEPIVESIVRRLLAADCDVVFLILYHDQQNTPAAQELLSIYHRIAAHYRIPILNPGKVFAERLRAGDFAPSYLLRDRVHTRPIGSFFAASLIAEALDALQTAELPPASLPPPLLPHEFPLLKMLHPAVEGGRWGTFQLVQRYLDIGPDNLLEASLPEGEILGFLFVNGPSSGSLRIQQGNTDYSLPLRDKWCHYDRLHVLRLPAPVPPEASIRFSPLPTPEAPLSRFRLVALLARQTTTNSQPATFRLLPA